MSKRNRESLQEKARRESFYAGLRVRKVVGDHSAETPSVVAGAMAQFLQGMGCDPHEGLAAMTIVFLELHQWDRGDALFCFAGALHAASDGMGEDDGCIRGHFQ
jgi:hypothetical protein